MDKQFRNALYLGEVIPKKKQLPCLWNSSKRMQGSIPHLWFHIHYPTLSSWCSLNLTWRGRGIQPSLIKAPIFFPECKQSSHLLTLHCTQQGRDCIHYFIISHKQWQTSHWLHQSVYSMSESKPTPAQNLHEQNQNSINNKTLKTLPSME